MIYLLRGEIAVKEIGTVVVDVGGVGYGVVVPLSTYYGLGDVGSRVELAVHTSVRENSIELFGFLTDAEKLMFEKLLGVSGIGPRAALNVLSNVSVADLVGSIVNGDLAERKLRGVGAKTAAKIVNELGDKVEDIAGSVDVPGRSSVLGDTVSALLNLGYSRSEVEKRLPEIKRIVAASESLEDAIRDSLKAVRN